MRPGQRHITRAVKLSEATISQNRVLKTAQWRSLHPDFVGDCHECQFHWDLNESCLSSAMAYFSVVEAKSLANSMNHAAGANRKQD